jgi:UPF0042 nucleotide-binding protein
MRFLPNPHWVPALRPRNGRDADVADYVLSQPGAVTFLDQYLPVLETLYAGFLAERKHYVNVSVGCTGGKHRSVVLAEALGELLTKRGIETLVVHRDLGRE